MATEKVVLIERVKLPKLRKSREAKELSQPALAKKAGVSHYVVAVAELGRAIAKDSADKIAKSLGVQLPSLRN